jgi:hypothetical protein
MGRLILIFVLASLAFPAPLDDQPVPAYDFFGADLLSFNSAYNALFREYFGCPPQTTNPKECDFQRGHVDEHLFHLSRERAKTLFGLK